LAPRPQGGHASRDAVGLTERTLDVSVERALDVGADAIIQT